MYSQLPGRSSIRLLGIPATSTAEAGSVARSYSLHTFDLENDCPRYLALSYTWSAPTDSSENDKRAYSSLNDVQIAIRGLHGDTSSSEASEDLKIGRNLYEALESIRELGKSRWPIDNIGYIWIDSLCINQADLNERQQQVQLMGEIYRKAARGIAWLGRNTMPPATHIFFHRVLMERVETYRKAHDGSHAVPINTAFHDLSVSCLGLRISAAKLLQLIKFYSHTQWFYRAWILQEVILAQECVILCGNMALELYRLITIARLIEDTPGLKVHLEAISKEYKTPVSSFGDRLIKLDTLLYSHRYGGPKAQKLVEFLSKTHGANDVDSRKIAYLEYMITQCMMQGATDPRDKVYAVLGMTDSPKEGTRSPLIVPDYAKSTVEVFVDVAELCFTKLPYLSLLSWVWHGKDRECSDQRRGEGLPSWIPDFTVKPTVSSLVHLHSRANFRERYMNFDAAADDSNAVTRPIVSGKMLLLTGKQCGSIEQCFSTRESFIDRARLLAFLLQWCALLDAPRASDPNRTERVHQIISMFIFRTSTFPPKNEQMAKTLEYFHSWTLLNAVQGLAEMASGAEQSGFMTTILKVTDGLRHTKIVPLPGDLMQAIDILEEDQNRPGSTASEEKDRLLRSMLAFNDLSLDILSYRTVYRTDSDLVGLCPEYARAGDQVWLLQGGKVPFALRPTENEDEYMLLGECYVSGGMYGELISEGRAGEAQDIALV